MTDRPIRIKCTDDLRNVSYVRKIDQRSWSCVLSNGIPASMFYAGILGDEMAVKFALEDTSTAEEALAVMKSRGGRHYTYELV